MADDELREIPEAARMASDLSNKTLLGDNGAASAGDSPSDSSDEEDEDLNLMNEMRKQFSMIGNDDSDEELNSREPLCSILSRPSEDSELNEIMEAAKRACNLAGEDAAGESKEDDDLNLMNDLRKQLDICHGGDDNPEDDFETIRAIQRRFACYTDLREDFAIGNPEEDGIFKGSFPKEAFVDAIKKNRECQRLIRAKLLHVNSRIDQNKELRKRLEILKGFQVACRVRTGRALSNKSEARAQLISLPKKTGAKAMQYGPAENHQAKVFRAVLEKSAPPPRANWHKEENERLMDGVRREFQDMVFQRSINQINDGDESFADIDEIIASIDEVDLTPEMMRKLLPKLNWDHLAEVSVPGRSGDECLARWLSSEDPLINNEPWTCAEDKAILHCIQNGEKRNWFDIAVSLGTNRTPFQCLSRYQRSLNASMIKREWTSEEDDQLRRAVEAYGESSWQIVAASIVGRTGTQCSNRWLKAIHPMKQRIGRWTDEEDKKLKFCVAIFGAKNWNKISEFVPGRTQVQCRERWVNSLDPSLNLSRWTEEEDNKLREAIEMHGYCWSKVAACVPPRTDSQCRSRWKRILPDQVPLLKAAREMQKVSLISNFVDRESERPSLGPSDFVPSQEIICLLESSEGPKKRKRGKAASGEALNGTKKKRKRAKKNSDKTQNTRENLNVAS